jgi:hypothetical protein
VRRFNRFESPDSTDSDDDSAAHVNEIPLPDINKINLDPQSGLYDENGRAGRTMQLNPEQLYHCMMCYHPVCDRAPDRS